MRILKELYKTIIDFIIDLRSTRIMLLWISVGLFYFSVIKGVDHITLGVIASLLTLVFTFYFSSKNQQSKHQHEKDMRESSEQR